MNYISPKDELCSDCGLEPCICKNDEFIPDDLWEDTYCEECGELIVDCVCEEDEYEDEEETEDYESET